MRENSGTEMEAVTGCDGLSQGHRVSQNELESSASVRGHVDRAVGHMYNKAMSTPYSVLLLRFVDSAVAVGSSRKSSTLQGDSQSGGSVGHEHDLMA